MQFQPIDLQRVRRQTVRGDLLLAVVIAALLGICWAISDWARLSRMILPDPDDMMRLAQVRDWLAGQATNDWTQYRMAPPLGAPIHWSRINDAGIAAIILAFTPLVGRAHAEMAAVLTYPVLLFACAIFLSARIGRRLWGREGGFVAAVLTGLAFPGTTVFVPGRIDHHALQVVLVQLVVLMLMRAPGLGAGLAAGTAAAASLVVGLETAPQVVALTGMAALAWMVRGAPERPRLAGFAAGLGATTLFFLAFLRPTLWTAGLCDAFTPASSTAMLGVAAALGILSALTPRLPDWRWRGGVGLVLGAAVIGGTLAAFPICVTGPYGAVDPLLHAVYFPYISEAVGLASQSDWAYCLAMAGLPTVAAAASLWMLRRQPRWSWPHAMVAAAVLASWLVMLSQLRGAYVGAPLGAPVLAGLVVVARRQDKGRLPLLLAAWLAGAGPLYLELPRYLTKWVQPRAAAARAADERAMPQAACITGDGWTRIDRYPPGVVMASAMTAPYLIGATRMSTVGAGYHRSNAGNVAMYRFFLSPPDASRAIGRAWHVRYVLFCASDFNELGVGRAYPQSLAARLHQGRPPAWLAPLPPVGSGMRLYRVAP